MLSEWRELVLKRAAAGILYLVSGYPYRHTGFIRNYSEFKEAIDPTVRVITGTWWLTVAILVIDVGIKFVYSGGSPDLPNTAYALGLNLAGGLLLAVTDWSETRIESETYQRLGLLLLAAGFTVQISVQILRSIQVPDSLVVLANRLSLGVLALSFLYIFAKVLNDIGVKQLIYEVLKLSIIFSLLLIVIYLASLISQIAAVLAIFVVLLIIQLYVLYRIGPVNQIKRFLSVIYNGSRKEIRKLGRGQHEFDAINHKLSEGIQ